MYKFHGKKICVHVLLIYLHKVFVYLKIFDYSKICVIKIFKI